MNFLVMSQYLFTSVTMFEFACVKEKCTALTAVKAVEYSYVARNYESNGAKQFVTIRDNKMHTQNTEWRVSVCECVCLRRFHATNMLLISHQRTPCVCVDTLRWQSVDCSSRDVYDISRIEEKMK